MTAKKVIVAVHGIGDQSQFATAQQVLGQFSRYYGRTAAVPLGNFHNGSRAGVFIADDPDGPPEMRDLGFAEVYWADIPRQVVAKQYLLEDVQPWVRTIIGRMHQRRMNDLTEADVRMLEQVLGEMLQTIDVLERLFFLANKMGVFSFDLRKVLIDFLFDVQIVAEFKEQGGEIGKVFAKQMQDVHDELHPEEIYIVAHSEGTVVALLGLLTAMCSPGNPWISKVRGLMTIGSPIDKHLTLWPALFAGFDKPCNLPPQPIEWHNYYDYGDPVGFELETARARFTAGPWKGAFHFPQGNDHGFARYPLPGKAHNDYWQDAGVFGHFIRNVVEKKALPPPKPAAERYKEPPKSRPLAQIASWVLPYLGAAALLFCGILVLYKSVYGFLHPDGAKEGLLAVFSSVAAYTCLLAGTTVVARIQRLTRLWKWRLFGVLVFLLFVGGYQAISCLRPGAGDFGLCVTSVQMPAGSDLNLVWIALALVLAVSVLSRLRPAWGMRTLLIPGATAVAYVVYQKVGGTQGNLWPVLLAGAVFLYVWWLVALLFDLTFVWHRYIRMSVPIYKAPAAKTVQPIAPAPLSGRQDALGTP